MPQHTHTVLIIEPDAATRDQMADLLSPRFRVIGAATIDEAAHIIAIHPPEIVLIEVDLPNALEFILHLRNAHATKHLCIACVTTRAGVRDKINGFQAGADDYIVKPYQAATFQTRITLLMRVHQLNR
jgi:DNA-binding response OmpR family regulator